MEKKEIKLHQTTRSYKVLYTEKHVSVRFCGGHGNHFLYIFHFQLPLCLYHSLHASAVTPFNQQGNHDINCFVYSCPY